MITNYPDFNDTYVSSLNLLTALLNAVSFTSSARLDEITLTDVGHIAGDMVYADIVFNGDTFEAETLRIVAEGDRLFIEYIDSDDECYSFMMRDENHLGEVNPYNSQCIKGLSKNEVMQNLRWLEKEYNLDIL